MVESVEVAACVFEGLDPAFGLCHRNEGQRGGVREGVEGGP